MKVALYIPCYVDQLYPQVAIATLELLEKLNVSIEYPATPPCCGQPMANAGFEHLTTTLGNSFKNCFKHYDYIVCPSGSCTLHLKEHVLPAAAKPQVWELTEFLTDILEVKTLSAYFPHKVGLHQSCHGLRGLMLAPMSERMEHGFSKPATLLRMVGGLELLPLSRTDECCGFGGTFCVTEEAVSVKMGQDRIDDHQQQGVEYITGGDMSCLMHLEGILKRQGSSIQVKHIAEILNTMA